MNSREIVTRTLHFAGPARLARSFAGSDISTVSYDVETPATEWAETGGGRWERIDEWGNLWARVDGSSKGEVARGALDTLENVDAYRFPDFSQPESYDAVRAARAAQPDKYLLGTLPGFAFNIARKLRRIDLYLTDLLTDPERIARLNDRIDGLIKNMMRNYAAAGADGVFFPEDWGTQTALFIDPSLWHAEFAPRFEILCSYAHGLGLSVWMHSCGQIEAIVPALIRAGIDVLQFDQPELHGIATLAAHQYHSPITFWCPADIQHTLPTRNEPLIRARARELVERLWRGRGGFIAGYYEDNTSLGLEPIWQEFACDEFLRYGRCRLIE